MSGGTYNGLHVRIAELANELGELADQMPEQSGHADPTARKILRAHLVGMRLHLAILAEAVRAVDLNDSGDGCTYERELIRRCFALHELLEGR